MSPDLKKSVEERTGRVFGDLWHRYDDALFKQSVELFEMRWRANGERGDFFTGKRCLDAGCGGGRYSIAMALMGASSVVGLDVGAAGLEDARRRCTTIGLQNVEFREGSVLELPFKDEEFDFACCSGVLHHTVGVETGLRELNRVLKPGGSLYLLLYGAGGLYWPLNLVMRSFAGVLGWDEVARCADAAGLAANKRRTVLDDLFVPTLETYTRERLHFLLERSGFSRWRHWETGQMDHESSPQVMIAELQIREDMWRAGAASAHNDHTRRVELLLGDQCRSVIATAQELVEQQRRGLISAAKLGDAVIGCGHHRVIAEKR